MLTIEILQTVQNQYLEALTMNEEDKVSKQLQWFKEKDEMNQSHSNEIRTQKVEAAETKLHLTTKLNEKSELLEEAQADIKKISIEKCSLQESLIQSEESVVAANNKRKLIEEQCSLERDMLLQSHSATMQQVISYFCDNYCYIRLRQIINS